MGAKLDQPAIGCQRLDNKSYATLLRASLDGKTREVWSSGLRNTIGFGWHPVTKTFYGFDQGSDWHGDNIPPEELNVIKRGKDYGWPTITLLPPAANATPGPNTPPSGGRYPASATVPRGSGASAAKPANFPAPASSDQRFIDGPLKLLGVG